MNPSKFIFLLSAIIFSGISIFPVSIDATPYLKAKFQAVSRCNDEPEKISSWEKELNWNAIDCSYGLLGEMPGFSKAHVISHNKENIFGFQWLTHVRGGTQNESSQGSAILSLEGEISLEGITQANKDMTFLWIENREINLPEKDAHNSVTAENSFELQGSYYGALDNLTTFEDLKLKGILSKTSSIKLNFLINQNHKHEGALFHSIKDGFIKYHYSIISPETCKSREHIWSRGYFDRGPIQRLTNIICVSIGETSNSHSFGKFTHSIINDLERFSNHPKKYPLSSRVAKIRLQRFWRQANSAYGKKFRSKSKQLEIEAANFLNPKSRGSLLNTLINTRNNFSDENKREELLGDVVTALSKATSSYASIKEIDPNTLQEIKSISKTLGRPEDLTLDTFNEIIISTKLVGHEILDQASLHRLEANVLAEQAK
ncbi:MAG: hypothetical protein ACQ9MH_05640 [Nitrospinales bacterium]